MALVEQVVHAGWIQGRNGVYDIRELHVGGKDTVYIDGISLKRRETVNGGFGGIPAADFDSLCAEWLTQRGWQVTPPASPPPTGS